MALRPQRLLHDGLQVAAERTPDKDVLGVEGKAYSYGELLDAARRLANALRERGLQRGDRVAIFMENSWPSAVSIYGTLIAGGAFMVLNPQTKTDKLAYILDDSDATFLIAAGNLARAFVPALPAASKLRGVIASGQPVTAADGIEAFDEVLEASSPAAVPSETIPLDLAAMIYTSGTTGNPKGVMMSHQAMVFTAGSLLEYLRLDDGHRILNALPLAFDYGLYQLLMSVRIAATLVLERSFAYPAEIFQRIKEQQVTVFPGVPTVYARLISMHRKKKLCFPSVTRVTNTAAALPADFLPNLKEVFPNALIFKMYGLTECKRVCYLEPELLESRPTSVGKAIPGTETYVLNAAGERAAPGEVGILHVRGPHVMMGYWKKPEQSAEMLKEGPFPGERVLCTQDHFKVDEDGFLYFVGRSDDIIKTRGEKVSPIEVENALHGIPGIQEAAVIGIDDPVLGQAIRAYVALADGVELSEREIKKICLARLENFMVPQEVVFLDELPKTESGKIRKKGLEELTGK
jgi:amino acid adenylation domain-containing protein